MAKAGAVGKYTPEIVKQIVSLIEAGNFESVAYGAVGISHQTYYQWKKKHFEFNEAIKKAKSKRVTTLISEIKGADAWQAKAWMLERLLPQKYHLLSQSGRELNERLDRIEIILNEFLKSRN